MNDKNIAVVGFGYWGKNLIRNFHTLDVLRTICDADKSREKLVASTYPHVKFTTDFDEVLSDPEIEAVVIATPAETHFSVAEKAIESDKHVFVEKPLALTLVEGERLLELAAIHERILMVGHVLQYHPAVVRLKELISDGELGRIEYLYSNRLNMGKIRTEENILWSFAPHDISVMLGLLGEEPVQVTCQGADYLSDNVADVTMSQFVFPSGVRAHIFVSWLHPFKEQRLVVVGSQKMAVFDDTAKDKLVLYAHQVQWKNRVPTAIKGEAEVIAIDAAEPLRAECLSFLQCIESGTQPITDGREGLRVLRVLDACENALRQPSSDALATKTDDGMLLSTAHDTDPKCKAEALVGTANQDAPNSVFIHETASIDEGSEIGAGTKIWHHTHVSSKARIGKRCSFGQNCFVAPDVVVGENVKVQNNVSLYTGTIVEDDVFLGPSCVLTNVSNPRSQVVRHSLYEKTLLRRGATLGANATVVCGVEIGRYAFVAAGAVVTKDVADYALMMGTPAKQVGWMSRHGHRLADPNSDGVMVCPESGFRYREAGAGVLRCLDLDEDQRLPEQLALGQEDYRSFKARSLQPGVKANEPSDT